MINIKRPVLSISSKGDLMIKFLKIQNMNKNIEKLPKNVNGLYILNISKIIHNT